MLGDAPPDYLRHLSDNNSISSKGALELIWHYTVGSSFTSIIEDGLIRPATGYIPVGERPIVWFSTEQFWEPTVSKGLRLEDGTIEDLGMTRLLELNFPLFRIGVDPEVAPYTWSDLKSLSGMSSDVARSLKSTAKARGANPSRWRGTFDPVSSDQWKTVEYLKDGNWVTHMIRAS